MSNFYCQRVCGEVGFSIDEWNAAFQYCNSAGLSEADRNKILHPEPCNEQCFACLAIVGDRRNKTKALNNINHDQNNSNTQLPVEVVERIGLEARRFAFFNYIHAGLQPEAKFEDVETWPYMAQASYHSIRNYLTQPGCYPYKETTIFTEYATKLHQVEQEFDKLHQDHTEAKVLLTEVFQKHESGLLPDRFIYLKIKKFLYG
jgi:hypothetical protein